MNNFIEQWYNETVNEFESPAEGSIFISELNELFEEAEWEKAKELIFKIKSKIDVEDLLEYIEITSKVKHYSKSKKKQKLSSALMFALLNKFDGDKIFEIDKDLSFDAACALAEELREKQGGKQLAFVISNNIEIEGKIMAERHATKQTMELVKYYEPSRNDPEYCVYFGAGPVKARPVNILTEDYYAYDFEAKDKSYLLLSKDRVVGNKLIVKGMTVQCSDKRKVGGTYHLPSSMDVLFMTSYESNKKILSKQDFQTKFVGESHDDQVKRFLGMFRHPLIYEQTILVFLYSGIYDGYPIHLLNIGPPASGKSKGVLKPICNAMPDVYLEGDSTFRNYIPSYGGGTPSPGALLRSERICFADEFLTALVKSKASSEYGNMFGSLTGLLEWSKHEAGSGFGIGFSRIEPTMQVLGATNFQQGLSSLGDAAAKINNAAMSRIIWYVQPQEHIDWIKDNSSKIMAISEEERNPRENVDCNLIYDFMKSVNTKIDPSRVKAIYKEYEKVIPFNMSEVYLRYDHHIYCIIDGVSKYRWMLGEKEDFEVVEEEDYELAVKIFQNIIMTWVNSIDVEALSDKGRLKNLPKLQRVMYDYVSENIGIRLEELVRAFPDSDKEIGALQIKNLIKDVDGEFYPDWHYKFKDSDPKKPEVEVDYTYGSN